MLPSQAQSLTIFTDGRLCVGYHSGFSVYHITGDHHPICKLLLIFSINNLFINISQYFSFYSFSSP